jgi:PhnB protein
MMQTYVKGSKEAVDLYLKAFRGTLGFHVKNSDDTYYHSEINISGHILAVAEVEDTEWKCITGNTMQFCLHFDEGEEEIIEQAYELLKEGGTVNYPLGSCDFSPLMTDITDKFGVRWCLFI